MAKKKENLLEVIAHSVAGLHTSLDSKFDTLDKKIDTLDKKIDRVNADLSFKIDTIGFSHTRRIELLEDDLITIKKALKDKKIIK